MLDHLSLQCADVAASATFYDAVLAPIGGGRIMDFGDVIGFGVDGKASFWLGPLSTDGPNREVHVAFVAADRAAVRAFFAAAVATGAEVLHEPAEHPEYHPGYYGAFVRDPDGNNVEAVSHRPE
jgi:catechol 2,3-dioxygenase-like lactoylglutathione lyase family enzyme